jgi:anti-sigma regulatory factor (Ser/Thr protein kinase)
MMAARGKEATEVAESRTGSRLDLQVAARARSVGEARRAVASFLSASAVPSVVVDDIELVTSELVTNAVVHPVPSDHPIRICVSVGAAVMLEVAHHGPSTALPPVETWQMAAPAEPSGRGLGIVRRLCDEVQVSQEGGWAVVACGRRLPDGGGAG